MHGRTAALAMALISLQTSAPVARELPTGFVHGADLIPGLVEDIRYAGENNFIGRPIDGYAAPRCILTHQAAMRLRTAQEALKSDGLGLKVFDCYRPTRAVADFVRWARDPRDTRRKADFYPNIDKRDLFRLGYIAQRSSHSRGSTMDLTLIDLASGKELDMGTPFDRFDPATAYGHPGLGPEQRKNRARLRAVMQEVGFKPYDGEWWHFNLRDEPFPRTYFNFVVR
jgi:D-alanyl-D-alanine dipeptidase